MERLLPIVGVIIIAFIVSFMVKSSAVWSEYMQQTTGEGFDTTGIPDGYYMDSDNKIVKVPLGATVTDNKRGFKPITETTQKGSSIPVSVDPGADDLLHKDTNNFSTTYHSVDPAQYFNVKAIDKDGEIDFKELHDLFPPIKLAEPPFHPSYADSVLFASLSRDKPSLKYYNKDKYAAATDATRYDANNVKTVYHKSGVSN